MKKYEQLYEYFTQRINDGLLEKGDRIPSIRECASMFRVSKTTVENAYFMLQADGYVVSVPKSGYVVSRGRKDRAVEKTHFENLPSIKYDLKNDVSSADDFDFTLWTRYMKNALRQSDRFINYSSLRGEEDLRIALADYVKQKRNIITSPDRIIVGAGIYPLMLILFSLFRDRETFSLPDYSFAQGIALASEMGFKVRTRYKDADVIYVCPSRMTLSGNVMPVKRRMELVEYSTKKGSCVIEDDFDSDFLYNRRPVPSLYTLSEADNIVYLGSFSNLLIPGIRLSFMILTDELNEKLRLEEYKHSQTASKAEQIALAGFINDGHIYSRTRKLRRTYTRKAENLKSEIEKNIPGIKVSTGENGIRTVINSNRILKAEDFEKRGISLYVSGTDDGTEIVMSPVSLREEDYPDLIERLKTVLG